MKVPTNSAVNAWVQLMELYVGDAEPHVAGLLTQNAEDRRRPEDRTGRLRRDISRHLPPGELARHGEPERHRRVDVVAADVAQGVDGRHDHRAERQRDHAQIGHRERRIAVDDERGRDRSHADEDQKRGADELSRQPLRQRTLIQHGPCLL